MFVITDATCTKPLGGGRFACVILQGWKKRDLVSNPEQILLPGVGRPRVTLSGRISEPKSLSHLSGMPTYRDL